MGSRGRAEAGDAVGEEVGFREIQRAPTSYFRVSWRRHARMSTELTIEFIRQSVLLGQYEVSMHADEERLEDGLTILELEEALRSGEVLEDYPEDPRGHSCLVLGHASGQPVHFVCGRRRQDRLILITVYRPGMPKWRDERNRNR
jgi:hypothetical protein